MHLGADPFQRRHIHLSLLSASPLDCLHYASILPPLTPIPLACYQKNKAGAPRCAQLAYFISCSTQSTVHKIGPTLPEGHSYYSDVYGSDDYKSVRDSFSAPKGIRTTQTFSFDYQKKGIDGCFSAPKGIRTTQTHSKKGAGSITCWVSVPRRAFVLLRLGQYGWPSFEIGFQCPEGHSYYSD
jgi:hypothetical protein